MSRKLPPGWTEAEIGSLCSLINGRAFKPSDWTESGTPIVRIQNLNRTDAPMNRFDGEVAEKFYIDSGELLFAWSGTPGTSFGAHVWRRGRAILNQHIFRVLWDARLVERDFFRLAINHKLDELIRQAHGGAGLQHITKGKFERTQVLVPPLNEQRRIVEKVDALFAHSKKAKESLDRIPALLEKLKRSILAAAFRGDLTKDWRERNPDVEPASVLLERIRVERRRRWEEAELAKMRAKGKEPKDDRWKAKYREPEPVDVGEASRAYGADQTSWSAARLIDLCDPGRGIPYGIVQTGENDATGIPTVRCGDIKDFTIEGEKLKLVSKEIEAQYLRTRLMGDEVLIAVRGTVGATAVVPLAMAGANISREVAMIPPVQSIESRFLMYLLASPPAQAAIRARVKGVAQSGINLADLRELVVPLPPLPEQQEIVARIESFMAGVQAIADRQEYAVAQVGILNRATLAKAFRGELVVQDPNDPATTGSTERIRHRRTMNSPQPTNS